MSSRHTFPFPYRQIDSQNHPIGKSVDKHAVYEVQRTGRRSPVSSHTIAIFERQTLFGAR